MDNEGSVSRWIDELREGQSLAARELWMRFHDRLKNVARPHARPQTTAGTYDEEDVPLSAFAAFCQAVHGGKYPEMRDRDDLWQLLVTFTLRKARDRAVHEQADRRGGGIGKQDLDPDSLLAQTPTPEFLVMMQEECQRLVSCLQDPELEAVVAWRLEGYTDSEIAARLGYTRRTVVRMLQVIRQTWETCLS